MKICHYHRYNDRRGACVLTSPPWNPDACWGVRTTVRVISKASVSLRFADVLWFSSLSYRGLLFLRKSASPLQFTHHLFGADKGLARELQVLELWRNYSQGHLDPICACNRYRWNIKHLIILLTQETAKKTKQCIFKFHAVAYLPWPLIKMLEPLASRKSGAVNHS